MNLHLLTFNYLVVIINNKFDVVMPSLERVEHTLSIIAKLIGALRLNKFNSLFFVYFPTKNVPLVKKTGTSNFIMNCLEFF